MLANNNLKVAKIIDARKEKITADPAWELLKGVHELIIGKGKKFLVFHPDQDKKETILNFCLGRTGNLRAPTIKTGDRIIVGFNDTMYQQFIG